MLACDKTIRQMCLASMAGCDPVITPFTEGVSGGGVISFGLTCAGYDIRLSTEIWMFKNTFGETVDPKRFKEPGYKDRLFDCREFQPHAAVTIPAHGYVLGNSYEEFSIPSDWKGRCTGKSTYARVGILINVTPLEPGWKGHLTLEIANNNPAPAVVYIMEGIAQIEFEYLDQTPEKDYSSRGAKYQHQKGVTPAVVL